MHRVSSELVELDRVITAAGTVPRPAPAAPPPPQPHVAPYWPQYGPQYGPPVPPAAPRPTAAGGRVSPTSAATHACAADTTGA